MKKTLLVYKKSEYELYRNSQDKNVQEFLQKDSQKLRDLKESHQEQKESLETLFDCLENSDLDYKAIYRADLTPIRDYDLVIAAGGDGTLLEVSHSLKGIPILGYNTDPNKSVGHFCSADKENVQEILQNLDSQLLTSLNRLELQIDDNIIPEPILNDVLFAHTNPAATTRFLFNGEKYRNSGLLICTAAGSTAWMYQVGGNIMSLDSDQIQYTVQGKRDQEPQLTDSELVVEPLGRQIMAYLDGPHLRYDLNLGSKITVRKGVPLSVIGDLEPKRAKY